MEKSTIPLRNSAIQRCKKAIAQLKRQGDREGVAFLKGELARIEFGVYG